MTVDGESTALTAEDYPLILNYEEAAALARVAVHTILRWRRNDPTFPYRQHGKRGSVRIPRDAFLAWLAGSDHPTDRGPR